MEMEFTKGGEDWGRVDLWRRSKGVEVWAKLTPKIEELVQASSEGQGSYQNSLESYGRSWIGLDPTPTIKVHSLERPLDGPGYYLSGVCGVLKDSKGRINLSFLTFVGVGTPTGVRFMVLGPIGEEAFRDYGLRVRKEIQAFLREYLVPAHIGINITLVS